MANFSALNTGLSALIAHRKAAETISHNIANVNTEGFSRRRVDLKTEGIGAVAAVYARRLNTGEGVLVDGITRIRDEFLEAQYRTETATNSSLTAQGAVLHRIETAFPEPSDDGIAEQLSAFWSSWDGVVNQPDSEAARQNVLSRAGAVVEHIRLADQQVRTVRGDAVDHVSQLVDQVNEYSTQIASLNKAIKAATVANLSPNDLMDQRDLAIDKLTSLTGATVAPGEYNEVELFLGGRSLVHGDIAAALQVAEVTDPALTPLGLKRVEVQWAIDSYPTANLGGETAGYVAGANISAPKYLAKLDTVASQLVATVNALHTTGNDLDGNTGLDFFDPAGTTASTLAISADVAGQPRAVAAASATAGVLDTTVAEQLAALKQSPTGADVAYRSLVTGLGTDVQFLEQQSNVQGSVTQRLDQDRKNISGVNLDEEMVNLVAEQHAYSAAARVITTIDEMLDTLINRTGRVGL